MGSGGFADKGKTAGLICIVQDTDFMLDAPRLAVLSGEDALNSDAHEGGGVVTVLFLKVLYSLSLCGEEPKCHSHSRGQP